MPARNERSQSDIFSTRQNGKGRRNRACLPMVPVRRAANRLSRAGWETLRLRALSVDASKGQQGEESDGVDLHAGLDHRQKRMLGLGAFLLGTFLGETSDYLSIGKRYEREMNTQLAMQPSLLPAAT